MNLLRLSCLLLLTATAWAQKLPPTLEEIAAKRWSELNADRIAATADGKGITLSDVRRQIDPIIGQIRASAKTDNEFEKALAEAANETIRSMTERQLVLADFRSSAGKLPTIYIDTDIEETIRRDFGGDRNKFVASLRATGTTPLAYRKFIEDRIVFDYMVGQIRRAALDVSPGQIQTFYDKNKESFVRKEQVKLRQITLSQGAAESPEEAKERAVAWADALRHPAKLPATLARFKLSAEKIVGPATFADIAARISTDDYAKSGGDAGWRNNDELNEKVLAVIKSLPKGEVSDPIQFDIPGGKPIWFILKNEDLRAKGYAPISDNETLAEVEARVRVENMKTAVQIWLDGLRAKHHIEIR